MDLTAFDSEELLHLAINMAGQQRYADALTCLKQAAKMDPANGAVVYFIGIIYAQINLYARALATMQRAVQIDPNLHIAHFQIGLLNFTSNRVAEAVEAWKPLDKLGKLEPLYLFKTGLEALAAENFDRCREYITEGIALNGVNEPLNEDMRKILQRIQNLENSADDSDSDSDTGDLNPNATGTARV